MSKFLDKMRSWLMDIQKEPKKFVDREFMLNWFVDFRNELPPLEKYWNDNIVRSKTPVRSQRTHALVAGLRDCCDEAFSPKNKTLQMCTERMLELVPKVVGGILDEMHDKSKVTWEHLSVFGEEHITNFGYSLSWAFCTAELKEELKGHRSANAITESTLGSTTQVGASFISS